MTFDDVEIIQFNDERGNVYPVRDKKDFDVRQHAQTLDFSENMDLDEFISREDVYGEGSEDLSYAVVEHNAERMAEIEFSLSKLRKIDIPIIENI